MSKLRSWMDLPVFANDDLQIEIAAVVVGKTRVRKRMPARAPPREFHKLRARVRRHRRWIDAHGAPGGAPDREPSRYALRVGVRPYRRSCPVTAAAPLNRIAAPDGKVAAGALPPIPERAGKSVMGVSGRDRELRLSAQPVQAHLVFQTLQPLEERRPTWFTECGAGQAPEFILQLAGFEHPVYRRGL